MYFVWKKGGEERVGRRERGVEVLAWYFGNTCIYMYIWNYSAIISICPAAPHTLKPNTPLSSQGLKCYNDSFIFTYVGGVEDVW